MNEAPLSPDGGHDEGTPPRMPRWVKVSLIIAAVLVVVVAIVMLTGIGGQHGPGRHMSIGVGR